MGLWNTLFDAIWSPSSSPSSKEFILELSSSLKLLRLCRIGPICWPIWYDYSRNKINLIFNASNGWQFTRHLFWKYISIFLQKSNSRTRQIRINVRNIQVGLLAYKYKDRSTCIKCNPHISFFCIQTHFSLSLFLITLILLQTLLF